MKKLLFIMSILSATYSFPELIFDPVSNNYYTYPLDPKINGNEYAGLLLNVLQIGDNILNADEAFDDENEVKPEEILNQIFVYLKSVGTPTALRLLHDLRKNIILYPNGAVFRKIFDI